MMSERYCVHCRHIALTDRLDFCRHPQISPPPERRRSLVTGEIYEVCVRPPVDCEEARGDNGPCGSDAKLFERSWIRARRPFS